MRVARGADCHMARLTEADVLDIRARLARGEQSRDLAERYGVAMSNIHAIRKRRSWAHLPPAVDEQGPEYQAARVAARLSGLSANRPRGERCGSAKLTEAKVRDIRLACDAGETRRSIARRFAISGRNVGHIRSRSTWTHLP